MIELVKEANREAIINPTINRKRNLIRVNPKDMIAL
jgi:hypothetical protein